MLKWFISASAIGLIAGSLLSFCLVSCTTSSGSRRPSHMESKPLLVENNKSNLIATESQRRQTLEEKFSFSANSEKIFDWPVDQAKLTRGFLPKKRRPHLGIDLAGPKGTPILAAHDGTVIYTGRGFKGYGKMMMIEGKEGWATLYAHFSKILVKEGQTVKKGDVIGHMGRTGRATGNHLHFEVRNTRGPVDPLHYLPNGAIVARLVEDHKNNRRN